jgi:hypothetical protein
MDYYNRHRPHSANNGMAPAAAEEKHSLLSGFIRPLQHLFMTSETHFAETMALVLRTRFLGTDQDFTFSDLSHLPGTDYVSAGF